MKLIISGPKTNVAYWASDRPKLNRRAFGKQGRFRRSEERAFVRNPSPAANTDLIPSRRAGCGMNAGARNVGRSSERLLLVQALRSV